ncbi:MAG: glycosyltransferase [Bacteroidales bacterium]|nr:glycosyltransferase [Bacteroidales bacterium]
MKCFETYYSRFNVAEAHITTPPDKDLRMIVVIPSYNEPDITTSLHSLLDCSPTIFPVEIIVVVNAPENSPESVVNQNLETLAQVEYIASRNTRNDIKIYSVYRPDLPKKHAGVGFARKIGMDEAVRRFDSIGYDGIIINFDADSTCNVRYLSEIEKYFNNNSKIEGVSIYFEHPLQGSDYLPENYRAIAQYELYLRYFVEAQRYVGFPYAYQTIGSAFAVRASVYAAEGGMNRRQAGEDFYFLEKIITRNHYGEINTAQVYPSPRSSNRVPFGTGAAVSKLCKDNGDYFVYNPIAFDMLKHFFATAINLRHNQKPLTAPVLEEFLNANNFYTQTDGMIANSTSERTFMQRFFTWFDAFRMIKFLNFAHEKHINKMPVEQAAAQMAVNIGITDIPDTTLGLLRMYRDMERRC